MSDAIQFLNALEAGDARAADHLLPLVTRNPDQRSTPQLSFTKPIFAWGGPTRVWLHVELTRGHDGDEKLSTP